MHGLRPYSLTMSKARIYELEGGVNSIARVIRWVWMKVEDFVYDFFSKVVPYHCFHRSNSLYYYYYCYGFGVSYRRKHWYGET